MNKYCYGSALALLMTGCAQQGTQVENTQVNPAQLTGEWQVESIDQGGIIDSSHVTLTFGDDGRISGSAGCNRYSASMSTSDNHVTVSQAASTRMACPPAIMQQEQRFLSALSEVSAWHREAGTWLVGDDAEGEPRLKLIAMNQVADASAQATTMPERHYRCGNAGQLSVRPVSYEVVELSVADQMLILSQVPTASGAKYGEGDLSLWEHGDTAIFESGGRRFDCRAITP